MNDKSGLLSRIAEMNDVILDLGCGSRKTHAGSIGIDQIDYDCVDIVGDIFDVLHKIPDGTVDKVYSSHFLEHIKEIDILMKELGRVLKDNAQVEFIVPHFSNPYYYSDYTHKTSFGLYSLSYFCNNKYFRREVPNYDICQEFELLKVNLIFKSAKPFYFRYLFKKAIGAFFNISKFTMELYEDSFCYLFPCYEVLFVLKKH